MFCVSYLDGLPLDLLLVLQALLLLLHRPGGLSEPLQVLLVRSPLALQLPPLLRQELLQPKNQQLRNIFGGKLIFVKMHLVSFSCTLRKQCITLN